MALLVCEDAEAGIAMNELLLDDSVIISVACKRKRAAACVHLDRIFHTHP